jgi:hypothetical protein
MTSELDQKTAASRPFWTKDNNTFPYSISPLHNYSRPNRNFYYQNDLCFVHCCVKEWKNMVCLHQKQFTFKFCVADRVDTRQPLRRHKGSLARNEHQKNKKIKKKLLNYTDTCILIEPHKNHSGSVQRGGTIRSVDRVAFIQASTWPKTAKREAHFTYCRQLRPPDWRVTPTTNGLQLV